MILQVNKCFLSSGTAAVILVGSNVSSRILLLGCHGQADITRVSQLALLWDREGHEGLVAACHACFDFLHGPGYTCQQLHATVSHDNVFLNTHLRQTDRMPL